MKIEKINDNQIRCTLNKHDLASREIKLSELAYGTEKAKDLFRDMMQQASYEYGFEADDQPLMIEAIPVSSDSIILNISKVDDPDELDTRFSKFSPSYDDSDDFSGYPDEDEELSDDGADEIIEYFSDDNETDGSDDNIQDTFMNLGELIANKMSKKNSAERQTEQDNSHDLLRIYSFHDFHVLERLANVLKNIYFGSNTLYKDTGNDVYYLVVNKSSHSPEEFNRICNILTEYGTRENTAASREAFFREHFTLMIKDNAVQILSSL